MTGSRTREIVRRSLGALTVTALLGAAVAVAAGLSWPGPVRATDAVPASTRAASGLAPTHRRFHHVADPHDCADPDDLADPPKLAESLNSASPRDITDPENVTNSDPERQRPGRQSRHRHDGSPRPRRELLRQRGDHPASGRDRGCSPTRLDRRRRHRVRATAADGDQCGGHRRWASPGRSGRSHHQRGDAALEPHPPSRCSSVTA